MYCKVRCHNWQLQLIQTGLLACSCSTDQRQQERSQSSLQTQCLNQKQSSNWLPPSWHTLRDDNATDAQQLQWRRDPASSTQFLCDARGRRDQSRVFSAPCLAVCPTHCSPANLEATIEAEWILNSLSFCENGIFRWRQIYVIITYCRGSINGTFTIFQSPGMSG